MSAMLTREHTGPPMDSGQPHGTGRPAADSPPNGPQTADDVVIGLALTAKWMIITGRRLGQQPLLHTLPADQLVDFWDDYASGPGPATAPERGTRQPVPTAPPALPVRSVTAHSPSEPPSSPGLPHQRLPGAMAQATHQRPAPRAVAPTTVPLETAMTGSVPSPTPVWTATCR